MLSVSEGCMPRSYLEWQWTLLSVGKPLWIQVAIFLIYSVRAFLHPERNFRYTFGYYFCIFL